MALSSTATGFGILLAQLVVSSARTIVLAAGVGLLSSWFRLRVTSGRLFAWTAVLYAGLCMPMLACLVPPLSIAVPFLPPHASVESVFTNRGTLASVELPSSDQFVNTKAVAGNVAITPRARMPKSHNLRNKGGRASSRLSSLPSIQWTSVAAAVYLV